MNIPLIMALMAGQHRHRYTDSSGKCSVCGKMHLPHNWIAGQCTVCGFSGCTHDGPWVDFSAASHRCSVCGKTESHNFQFVHNDSICQQCLECGRTMAHSFANPTSAACGQCDVCGDEFTAHTWSNGKCSRCGYICKHPSVNDDQICDICGLKVVTGAYYVLSGIYAGSYIYGGDINNQRYYRQHCYNAEAGQWEAQGYYLVVLNIGSPTQFGGSYAYTCSGAVFVTDPENVPINSTLLSGNGRYNIHLKQYTLDGDFIVEGSYTSDDCKNLEGNLP